MAKHKGLGKDVDKSVEIMDNLNAALREFAHMPLKKGLSTVTGGDDEDLPKMINEASESAFALLNKVDDLKNRVKGINTYKSSRFATAVVEKFLKGQP